MCIYHEHNHDFHTKRAREEQAGSWGVDFYMVVINKCVHLRAHTHAHAHTQNTHIQVHSRQICSYQTSHHIADAPLSSYFDRRLFAHSEAFSVFHFGIEHRPNISVCSGVGASHRTRRLFGHFHLLRWKAAGSKNFNLKNKTNNDFYNQILAE